MLRILFFKGILPEERSPGWLSQKTFRDIVVTYAHTQTAEPHDTHTRTFADTLPNSS